MTPASHLLSPTVPGYLLPDGRCFPCSGISGGAFNFSQGSSRSDYKILPKFKVIRLRSGSSCSRLSVCNAYSGGQKRNPDFSRLNKQGHSINRTSRQNEERDGIDDDETEFFLSKNGPSVSSSPQYQATATPGRKEKEIVELFKKVQAKLRERGAYKDMQKFGDSQGLIKQNETVDSLLNLLRKHSAQQGKGGNSSGARSDFNLVQLKENDPELGDRIRKFSGPNNRMKNFEELLNQPKQNGPVLLDKNRTSMGSKRMVKDAAQDSKGASSSRPISSFRRRSPVSQFKYEPIFSDEEETISSEPFTNVNEKTKKTIFEAKPKPELEIEPELDLESESDLESELEPEPETELFLSDESILAQLSDDEASGMDEVASKDDDENESRDLSGMKLPELRALAKSRGIKGISRLKKLELAELLAGGPS